MLRYCNINANTKSTVFIQLLHVIVIERKNYSRDNNANKII